MDSIYDTIYDRVCSLLTDEKIAELRTSLRSAMEQRDLAAFCNDHSKLTLVNYDHSSVGRGPVRAFRSSVFSVGLLVVVETDPGDTDVRQVHITAEIQDGDYNESRRLATLVPPQTPAMTA